MDARYHLLFNYLSMLYCHRKCVGFKAEIFLLISSEWQAAMESSGVLFIYRNSRCFRGIWDGSVVRWGVKITQHDSKPACLDLSMDSHTFRSGSCWSNWDFNSQNEAARFVKKARPSFKSKVINRKCFGPLFEATKPVIRDKAFTWKLSPRIKAELNWISFQQPLIPIPD